jgi:hypothetical protein
MTAGPAAIAQRSPVASEKQPPSVRSLTTSLPTDLMMTSTREPAQHGGRDHRNPWPASIGTGGRLRAESPADFVGMRTLSCLASFLVSGAREIDCFGAGGKITSGLNPSEAAKEKHRQAATRSVANFGRLKDYWKAKPIGKPGSATAE